MSAETKEPRILWQHPSGDSIEWRDGGTIDVYVAPWSPSRTGCIRKLVRELDEARAECEALRAERDKLHRTVVRNAGHRATNNGPRWAFVADALAVGSTSAIEACRQHELDPYECVGAGAIAAAPKGSGGGT